MLAREIAGFGSVVQPRSLPSVRQAVMPRTPLDFGGRQRYHSDMTSTAPDPTSPTNHAEILAAIAELRRWAEGRLDRVEDRLRRIEGELAELKGRVSD